VVDERILVQKAEHIPFSQNETVNLLPGLKEGGVHRFQKVHPTIGAGLL
jgi:hypothetical protein